MLKKFALFFLLALSIYSMEIVVPKAPPAIPLLKLEENEDVKLSFYTNVKTEVVPDIIKGKEKLYIIPVNLGAKLYNAGKDIRLLGIVSNGLLSFVSSDENIDSVKKIDGKTVYVGARGSSPDVISGYIFGKANIKPKVEYRTSPEIAKLMIAGKIENAILPEPLASMVVFKNKKSKRVLELKEEFNSKMPQVGIFCSNKYFEENKNELIKLKEKYSIAVEWVKENETEAVEIGRDKLQLKMPPIVVKNSLSKMTLTFIPAKEAKQSVERFIEELSKMSQEFVGGKTPDEEFYLY